MPVSHEGYRFDCDFCHRKTYCARETRKEAIREATGDFYWKVQRLNQVHEHRYRVTCPDCRNKK